MTHRTHEPQLSFRPMGRNDLPLLQRWLAQPHVSEWWDDAAETIEAVEARDGERIDGERIDGEHHVVPWIMELDSEPVGFIQWYRVADEAEWFPDLEIPPGTIAVDLAIGEPDHVGVGHGRRLLLEFVHHVVRTANPDCPEVWIDPNPRNQRAVRAYRAAGFVDTGIDLPDPDAPGEVRRLMRLRWAGPPFR